MHCIGIHRGDKLSHGNVSSEAPSKPVEGYDEMGFDGDTWKLSFLVLLDDLSFERSFKLTFRVPGSWPSGYVFLLSLSCQPYSRALSVDSNPLL
jgi:hypothetical protein